MTKLEKLYQSIENLKELGLPLNQETLNAVSTMEEDLIKNEIIPRLSGSIEPIITQIKRPIVLVVDYVPDETLSVRLTRKRVITEDSETKEYPILSSRVKGNKTDKVLTSTPKSSKTRLKVIYPNGRVISNKYAYQTLIDVIENTGVNKVEKLKIEHLGMPLISKAKDDFYDQHQLTDGSLIITHSSTYKKKQIIDEISNRLCLDLVVEII